MRTLILDHRGIPARTSSWEEAIVDTMEGRLTSVIDYPGRVARSSHLTVPIPAVAQQRSRVPAEMFSLPPTRRNIFARDAHTCAYCGERPRLRGRPCLDELTIDHVIPRSRAVNGRVWPSWREHSAWVHGWENLVTACGPCNWRKGERTPEEVSMPLRFTFPAAPDLFNRGRILIRRYADPPPEWGRFLGNPPLDLILEVAS